MVQAIPLILALSTYSQRKWILKDMMLLHKFGHTYKVGYLFCYNAVAVPSLRQE